MSTNPRHIPLNHPVRMLLRMAVTDDLPSGLLTQHLDGWDAHLPEGHLLSKYRGEVYRAARQVRSMANRGEMGKARALADELAADIAGGMSDHERSATGDPEPESTADIAARMFAR